MDLYSMLKLANIFSPSGQPTQQNFPVGSVGGPQLPQMDQNTADNSQPDLMSTIQGLLNPKDQQFQNFSDLINQMPQRQNYQPSKLRQIAGAIAGMGTGSPVGIANGQVVGYKSNIPEGRKVQESITDEPYNKALSDWQTKVKPEQEIAQMEANRNVNLRQIGLGELSRQQQQQKIDAAAKQNEVKNEQNQQNIDIRRAREESYVKAKQFQMDHPTFKSVADENGDLYFWDPQNPTAKPVSSGLKQITPLEKIDFQVQGTLKEIEARTSGSQTLESQKQANRKELESSKQIDKLELKREVPGKAPSSTTAGGTKPLLPTQQKVDVINRAQKLISDRPDLKGYVVFDKNNAGNITGVRIPPSGYFGNEQKRMEAYNLLFGQAAVPGVSQTNQPNAPIRKEIPGHPGKFAISSDGGKTWKAE
jgi:hypothetical protein